MAATIHEAEARLRWQAVVRIKMAKKLSDMLLGPVVTGPFHERGFPAVVDSDITFAHFGAVFRHTADGVQVVGEAYCQPFDEGRLHCAVMPDAATMKAAMEAERRSACSHRCRCPSVRPPFTLVSTSCVEFDPAGRFVCGLPIGHSRPHRWE